VDTNQATTENLAEGVEQAAPKFIATCDQEVWVMDRIRDAITMALAIRENSGVRANEFAVRYGIQGIVEGTTIEIIHTLGGRPEFTNLRDPFDGVPDGKSAKVFRMPQSV
jgi:hypothetical protein